LKRHVEHHGAPKTPPFFHVLSFFATVRRRCPGSEATWKQRSIGALAQHHRQLKESMMNWDRVEGNWKQFKGKVQQQWGKLTDDDLDVIEGNQTELAGRLQERYGYAKDEAEKQIDSWMKTIN
jgi:uncharacterized protein YjbJ (UPF0337 family)